jgi:hypothetical protein
MHFTLDAYRRMRQEVGEITSFDLDVEEAYQSYIAKADQLWNTSEVAEIADRVATFYSGRSNLLYDKALRSKYFVVGAPAGSGKTQLGFSLARYTSFRVVHICLVPTTRMPQDVYRHPNIACLSEAVFSALHVDHMRWLRYKGAVTTDMYATEIMAVVAYPLCVVAALAAAFDMDADVPGGIVDVGQLRAAISSAALAGKARPLLVVDEAFQDRSSVIITKILRTVARVAGLATLFMGTTANMALFVEPGGGQEASTELSTSPWAVFLTKLPALQHQEELPPTGDCAAAATCLELMRYTQINPRNYLRFRRELDSGSTSAEMCLAIAATCLYREKGTLRTTSGVRAQVQYQLNSARVTKTGALVTNHFARFPDSMHGTEIVLLQGNPVRKLDNMPWKPAPDFPSMNEDPLLALLLGGPCTREGTSCAHPPPFAVTASGRSTALSSAAALILALDDAAMQAKQTQIELGNKDATKRDGNVLECIVALATINASRAGSVGNTNADLFLRHFITERLPVVPQQGPLRWSPASATLSAVWTLHDTWTSPWVARVQWSDEGAAPIPALGLQMYKRTPDKERIDGRVDHIAPGSEAALIGVECLEETDAVPSNAAEVGRGATPASAEECKNHENELSLAMLYECVDRWSCHGEEPVKTTKKAGAPNMPSAASNAGKPALGLLAVAKLPTFCGTEPTSALADKFRAVLRDANIVSIKVLGGQFLQLERINVINSEEFRKKKMSPMPRLYCVVECDEGHVRDELWKQLPDVARAFGVPPPETVPHTVSARGTKTRKAASVAFQACMEEGEEVGDLKRPVTKLVAEL